MTRQRLRNPNECPSCGGTDSHVTDVEDRQFGYVYRRHACRTCGERWPSYQSLAHPKLIDPDDLDPSIQANR